MLNYLDWICIALFFVFTLVVSLIFSKKAGKSLSDFFLGGRSLPWYVAGFSMVATTFAADTPLAVTELVVKFGVAGNWLWWNMLIGGMLTTFFFAKQWRRANIMTEVELIEVRYGGKPAAFLRGFKAIYLGLFMNTIIIGWVNKALIKIFVIFFGVEESEVLWYVAGAMIFTALYSAIGGLWSVAITDVVQFIIAMIGCIVLAVMVVHAPQIGSIAHLKERLPIGATDFLPNVGDPVAGVKVLSISVLAFFGFVGVQWWASWYPGAEPGGGGYVAQRMMSAKDEKSSLWATLFFQVAHYGLRPWPWIITALCASVLYPHLEHPGDGFVYAMRDYLPSGLKGLLIVTFLAAYMSTISTQLNWGASYIINDFYKRFIYVPKKDEEISQKHLVNVSRVYTMIAMLLALYVTTLVGSISDVWAFVIESGAGLGLVLILRWYWWRINVWSEIVATIAPFFGYGISRYYFGWQFPEQAEGLYFTVAFTTVAWVFATFVTKSESIITTASFYDRIKPMGIWDFAGNSDIYALRKRNDKIPYLVVCWLSAISMTYCLLFSIGNFILEEYDYTLILTAGTVISGIILYLSMKPADLR